MHIMWPTSQSHFHLVFIFIEMKFNLSSFLCDRYNEVDRHKITIIGSTSSPIKNYIQLFESGFKIRIVVSQG